MLKEETYSLYNQMRWSAVSIPSNIAEEHERGKEKKFVCFLLIARASRAKLETQLQICLKIEHIS